MKSIISLLFLFIGVNVVSAQKFTVAKDGSWKYKTIQAALDAVPSNNKKQVVIKIKPGVYNEVITVDATKKFVTFKGEDKDKTIITYNNHAGTVLPNGDTLNLSLIHIWRCRRRG